jgi:UDP-glucose 4-epimerase
MKIFIIGGAGYIGSHMVKIAHLAGHNVITIDNLSTGHRDAVLYGEFEYCDLLNSKKLDYLFKKYKPDAVMHFGAFSLVGESMAEPNKYYQNNVLGSLNLLNAMIKNNCLKIVFSSTASVYGDPEYIPINENHPKKPINPYGKSKLMVEEILKDFDTSYGLKFVSFRYFNAAGHDPEGELSERHNPETHLIPNILKAARGENESVSIFGVEHDTKDGTCIRDYIHVNDIADAHLLGLNYLNNDKQQSAEFNLGNGKGFSVKEVIDKVKYITKKNFKVEKKDRRKGDPAVLIADDTKARRLLKFKPKYKSLDEIIKTLVID